MPEGFDLKNIALILTSLVTIASIIVKLTPSKKDDEVVGVLMKIIKFFALDKKK